MAQSSDTKDVDDLCLCGRGKLHEGFTELRIRVQDTLLVIKNVPARVCDLCGEAYISTETSQADRRDHGKVSRRKASSKTHSCR